MNKALKFAIIERGLKQYDIARRIGIGEARMSGFIHERFEPTDDEKKKLARLLKKETSELFGEAIAS